MAIVYASNGTRKDSGDFVLKYLAKKKAENPNFKVLDIGGSANSWADQYVDAYVDLIQAPSGKPTFTGDINQPEVWNKIQEAYGKADFIICSHTLEDIRDPIFVIKNLLKSAKAGYISTPNKYAEFSHVESHYFVGCSHHRWIFSLKPTGPNAWTLEFMPKYASANIFSRYNRSPWVQIKRLLHLTNKDKSHGALDLPSVAKNAKIATLRHELGFVWENDFEYRFTDFFPSTPAIMNHIKEMMETGL